MNFAERLSPQQRALFWQICRYGLTGLFVTACQAAIYWSLAALAGLHVQLANLIGYGGAVCVGYVAHSLFTFRDQTRSDGHAARGVRRIRLCLPAVLTAVRSARTTASFVAPVLILV